ncbi:tol-pal system protein YbgF [Limnohabitans sp. MMS-10A-160]|jgi:tol-pal system protein YbgF|uniref:tol-pal system protein YbgF n=1 Tax=unclassified Limnohabitans TaxID=2626134 RepID=UPI000D3946A2|nr:MULTISPECIES: tol-pal system protein YbgF [unclassified Limnohabitans]PUE22090.1 tol-pal system protein YbgF [Limnohabitans sp. MMS-10A-192]PUE25741.1 tol-pal system protein YbgF [Limnohabitans sp. MMS-10A-160]
MRLNFRFSLNQLALALALSALTGLAQAALFDDDEARRAILDLRQRLEQSNKNFAEENAQLRRSLLDLQSQIESLRGDLSQSRGAHENLARDVSDVQQRQKDVAAGVDERLRKFEPVKVSVDGREFLVEPAEKRDYEAAMDIFRKGDFVAAQTALVQFLQRNGKSGYAPSALFWLGNAQYANKSYKDAMANFQQLLNVAPGHARAPEAMLAISNVQLELKDLKAARKTLDDLVKAFPASEAANTARDRLTRLR